MSIQFSRSVVSDLLWLHGLQHIRLPCPSPTPRAYSNSCPSRQWCHPTISSPDFNLSQHKDLFQWVGSLHHVVKVLEFQLQHQSFQWIFRSDFLWNGLVGCPCSPRDSQESSPTPQFKSINSLLYNEPNTITVGRNFIFKAPKSLQMVTAAMNLKDACSLEEKLLPT